MGILDSKQSQTHVDTKSQSKLKFDESERKMLIAFYHQYLKEEQQQKQLNFQALLEDIFLILSPIIKGNIVNYLNQCYKVRNWKKTAEPFDINDFLMLAHILLKSHTDSDDALYYHKNIFLILYDITKGKPEAYKDIKSLKDIFPLFSFVVLLYFNKYQKDKHKSINPFTDDFNEQLLNLLTANIFQGQDSTVLTTYILEDYIDNKLYALDGLIKTNLREVLYQENNQYSSPFPRFNEPPVIISTLEFFFFCLSATSVSNKSYAFKLFDSKISGYNLSNLIYSFIGFPGPITIMIQHFDKEGKQITFGMLLNSNFKECYEQSCGDDLSFIFTIEEQMKFYHSQGKSDKYCFISSRNQKYSKIQPGIGMGYNNGNYRIWLDMNELFSQSYFCKYDDVFEEGSPLDSVKEKLNIGNIEVYGYGSEDALELLSKKQDKDKALSHKMRQVDKSAFISSEFDKEMFFGKTYQHHKQIQDSS